MKYMSLEKENIIKDVLTDVYLFFETKFEKGYEILEKITKKIIETDNTTYIDTHKRAILTNDLISDDVKNDVDILLSDYFLSLK